MKRAGLALAAALLALPAAAGEGRPPVALSLQLPALLTRGVDVQVEPYLGAGDAWSLGLGGGLRVAARGDYRGLHTSFGVEARRWWWRGGPWARVGDRALGGLYTGARLDAGLSRLTTADGREVGSGLSLTPALTFGYRLVPLARLELTPSFGFGATAQLEPGLPTPVRLHAVMGLTVGWIF